MTIAQPQTDDRRARVIEAATELFWRHGYDGVSIGDLVEVTGMNRYALYQEFGGKKEIFLAACDHYVGHSRETIRMVLARPGMDPADAVFECIVAKMLDPAMFPAGCLICTTAVDVAAKDDDVAEKMEASSREIRADFADAFAKAQAEGRAARQISPEAFGEIASALYFSTGVQARMGRSQEELLSALKSVIDGLRYQPTA